MTQFIQICIFFYLIKKKCHEYHWTYSTLFFLIKKRKMTLT